MTDPLDVLPPLPPSALRFEVALTKMGERLDYTAEQMHAYGLACFRAGTERAAKVCDTVYAEEQQEPVCYGFASECAAAIRKGIT